jgi:Cd2+-exporting ATPase
VKCIKAAAAIECSLECANEQGDFPSDTSTCQDDEKHDHHHEEDHGHHNHSHGHDHAGHDHTYGPKPNKQTKLPAHKHAHAADGSHLDEPCNDHLKAAMDKYMAYLESARCVCRSILSSAAKLDTCCSTLPCSSGPAFSTSHSHHLDVKEHGNLVRHRFQKKPATKPAAETKCCGSNDHVDDIEHGRKNLPTVTSVDVEKMAGLSHALLNVTGMDCSGCANNLTRAIRNAAGTANVSVIFISGTAEFDFDPSVSSLDAVIRRAQQATGYKLTPFSSDTQTIDVMMSATEAVRFRNNLPRGVERCEKVSKTTYEISYDPCVTGARDMLSGFDAQLAAPRAVSYADAGKRRLLRVSALTTAAFILTVPVVTLEWGRPSGVSERTGLIVAIVLATMVQAIAVPEFYIPAISSLVYNKIVEMDMLVVISITAAYLYSIAASGLFFAGVELETRPFFETSTLLITLILLGRLLAAWARKRAVKAVSMRSLQASTALLINQTTGNSSEVDARLLQYGDKISILPHSRVVTDADVLEGTSEVDESMLTGEALPVFKTIGSSVVSGTVNGAGSLVARVSRLPGRNTITDIANLVEQAQGFKPHVQDLADKIAGYFVPVVCSTALIVFITWLLVGLKVRDEPAGAAVGTAIGYCIAVLAISCPCALGLAVPMVLVVAGGVAARGGVIIKSADVIERGFKVTDVVFDKTGTLTEPTLEVVRETAFPTDDLNEDLILSLASNVVKSNKHPVSEAVAKALAGRASSDVNMDKIESVPGRGVEAIWQGKVIRAGNAKWLGLDQTASVAELAGQGLTMLAVTVDGRLSALFGLKSQLRDGAAEVIRDLHGRHVAVHIVSGDARKVVEGVAAELGIPQQNVAYEKTPAQKQEYVRHLMEAGKITLFCGDGTNDAVAVAQANVGVQIESSSDVTRATADVILLRSLDGVVNLLDVSKAAFRRITFNFIWSAVYNVGAILLAAGAFVKFRIPPAYAGLGEVVSVLPVIIVALTQPKLKVKN